jgi:hypothetical protein
LVFQFLLPALQVMLFCLAIGDEPAGIKLGLIMQDQGANLALPVHAGLNSSTNAVFWEPSPQMRQKFALQSDIVSPWVARARSPFAESSDIIAPSERLSALSSQSWSWNAEDNTIPVQFGSSVVQHIDSKVISLVKYLSVEDARADALKGKCWGFLNLAPTFSQDLYARLVNSSIVNDATLFNASVNLDLDMTDQQIAITIQTQIEVAFLTAMSGELLRLQASGLPVTPSLLRPPVQQVFPPIYGEANPKFTDFIAPGMIIAIAFAQSIGLTAMSVVMARLEGTQDRYGCLQFCHFTTCLHVTDLV